MPDARPVVERLLRRLSAPGAPWTVVEATDARYRDVTVARTILSALTARLAQQPAAGVAMSPELFAPGADQLTVLSHSTCPPGWSKDDYRKRLDKLQARLHGLSLEARERGHLDRAGLRGLGRRRQGRRHPPGHPVAGGRRLPGDPRRRADRRGGAPLPLPVALLARPAAGRDLRHLRPHLVRPGAGRAGRGLRHRRRVAAGLRRDQRLRGAAGRARLRACRSSGCTSRRRSSWPASRPARTPRTSSTRSPRRTTATASGGTSTSRPSTRWCCGRRRMAPRGTSSRPTTSYFARIEVLEKVTAGLKQALRRL